MPKKPLPFFNLHGQRVLTVKEKEMIKTLFADGNEIEDIAKYFDCHESLIYNALPLKYFLAKNNEKTIL